MMGLAVVLAALLPEPYNLVLKLPVIDKDVL